MPGGEIIRSNRKGEPAPAPHLELGLGEKLAGRAAGITNIQGVLQFMIDTAAETKTITEEYRDAQRETNRLLGELIETLKSVIAETSESVSG